jgi:hypothetical protein
MPDHTTHTRRRPSFGARVAALIAASVFGLLAFGFLATGGTLLWANAQADEQGYISTGTDRFATGTYALATEDLDVDADVPGWLLDRDRYGQVRLQVTPNTDEPVFVGVARTQDVDAYLGSTARATVADLDYEPFKVDYDLHAGDAPPTPPSTQDFWAASAQGADKQTVAWDVEEGNWSVVVMNADGSRGVDAGVSAGVDVPLLATIGWASLGGGALLLVAAGGLFFAGARPPRTRPEPVGGLEPVAA